MSHEMCFGEVAERSIAAGCKPAAFGLRRFEPSPPHHSTRPCGPRSWRANAGASEWCPERAERSSESKGDDVCFGGKRRFTPPQASRKERWVCPAVARKSEAVSA